MKKRVIKGFLAITICFSMSIFQSYLLSATVSEADFLLSDIHFENPDLGVLPEIDNNQSPILLSNDSQPTVDRQLAIVEHFRGADFIPPSLGQESEVLRC